MEKQIWLNPLLLELDYSIVVETKKIGTLDNNMFVDMNETSVVYNNAMDEHTQWFTFTWYK